MGGRARRGSLDDVSEGFEGIEDGGDSLNAFLGLAAETGGEAFGEILRDGGGGLEFRAQPADQAALFFRRALVVERDEAGEGELFEGSGSGAATAEAVGDWGELRRSVSVAANGRERRRLLIR